MTSAPPGRFGKLVVRVPVDSPEDGSLIAALAVVYGLNVGLGWLAGEPEPDAPGEVCERDYDGHTGSTRQAGSCYPLPGWHVEPSPNPNGRADDAYVRDGASDAQWTS